MYKGNAAYEQKNSSKGSTSSSAHNCFFADPASYRLLYGGAFRIMLFRLSIAFILNVSRDLFVFAFFFLIYRPLWIIQEIKDIHIVGTILFGYINNSILRYLI